MSRHHSRSDVEVDRYEDRSYVSRGGRSRHDDVRYEETDFRRGSGPLPTRERERNTVIFKEKEEVDRRTPAFLKDDYGRSTAGPMVLRAREREDFEFRERSRRRSPSPEVKKGSEEIIIRTDRREERPEPLPPPPPKPRERSRDREEIIIRRDERSRSRGPARFRDDSREREEIIIRRDEREEREPPRRAPARDFERDREEVIIRRDDREVVTPSRRGPTRDFSEDRQEIIIRRDDRRSEEDDIASRRNYRPPPSRVDQERTREEIVIRRDTDRVEDDSKSRVSARRYEDDLALTRPISRERARSRGRSDSRSSQEEIVIRRDEREGRTGDRERQEIIIRRSSRSRSSSPATSVRTAPPPPPAPEPQVVYAPQIHQEVITHHRHIDHGYEVHLPPRPAPPVYSRPPTPPSPPPPPRERSEERIEISRTNTRNGRTTSEDIVIDRQEGARSAPPVREREREVIREDIREEDYRRGPRGYEERDVSEEIDIYRDRDTRTRGAIGPRFGRPRDPTDGLWTEVTKDLVIKEAIQEMGYEYDETDEYYYIFKHLRYADMARLVGLSDEIRRDRHKRIKEIQWENSVAPRPYIEPPEPRLAIEGPPGFRERERERERDRDRPWSRDEERYVEREVVYRGGRPPPPVGWRR